MHRIYRELGLPGGKTRLIKIERINKKIPTIKSPGKIN
jgi:hypothetical protein